MHFGILNSKSVMLIRLFVVLTTVFFHQVLLVSLKVNYPVNMENDLLCIFSGCVCAP